jgi:hypothetical protein
MQSIKLSVRHDPRITHPFQVFGLTHKGHNTVGDGDTEAEALGDWIHKAAKRQDSDHPDLWYRFASVEEEHSGWTNRETWAVASMIRDHATLAASARLKAIQLVKSPRNGNPGHEFHVYVLDKMVSLTKPHGPMTPGSPREQMVHMMQTLGMSALMRADWNQIVHSFAEQP